mgnify:CR=1 FL=1
MLLYKSKQHRKLRQHGGKPQQVWISSCVFDAMSWKLKHFLFLWACISPSYCFTFHNMQSRISHQNFGKAKNDITPFVHYVIVQYRAVARSENLGGHIIPTQWYMPPQIFRPCDGPVINIKLTLYQSEGADYAHHINGSTPGFEHLTTALRCR